MQAQLVETGIHSLILKYIGLFLFLTFAVLLDGSSAFRFVGVFFLCVIWGTCLSDFTDPLLYQGSNEASVCLLPE